MSAAQQAGGAGCRALLLRAPGPPGPGAPDLAGCRRHPRLTQLGARPPGPLLNAGGGWQLRWSRQLLLTAVDRHREERACSTAHRAATAAARVRAPLVFMAVNREPEAPLPPPGPAQGGCRPQPLQHVQVTARSGCGGAGVGVPGTWRHLRAAPPQHLNMTAPCSSPAGIRVQQASASHGHGCSALAASREYHSRDRSSQSFPCSPPCSARHRQGFAPSEPPIQG